MMITTNGVKLHVEQRGAGAPALVFLHYWGGSSHTWRHVVEALAPAFRTVTIDQRGWGQSEAPTSGYALADMADDALGIIETLDLQRYILVAFDGWQGLAADRVAPPAPLGGPCLDRTGPAVPPRTAARNPARHGSRL